MSEGEGTAEGGKKVITSFALVRECDMPEEMKVEVTEMCTTACERFTGQNESAARYLKESMDKKFGPCWHCIVGEGFGFVISHDAKSLMYMYYGGNMGVCIWKCS